MDGVNIGSYDSTSPSADSMLSADGSGSKQGLLDDLPSTAMWLLNKVRSPSECASTGHLEMLCW